jgi:LPXTG-motif cell wall-anchored protein
MMANLGGDFMNMHSSAVRRASTRSIGLKALIFVAGILSLLFVAMAPASAAPAYPPPPPPSISLHSGSDGGTADGTSSDGSTPPLVTKALASTGSDVSLYIYVGAGLLLLGGLSLYVTRRRSV